MNSLQIQIAQSLNDLDHQDHIYKQQCQQTVLEIENLITDKFRKMQNFLSAFENDLDCLHKQKMKDGDRITKIQSDMQRRKQTRRLMMMAYEMEEGLVYQLRQNLHSLEAVQTNIETAYAKEEATTNQLDVEIQNRQKIERNHLQNPVNNVQVDKAGKKLIFRIRKESTNSPNIQPAVYEVNYNVPEDKFTTVHSNINQAVYEFNFHKNIAKLYNEILLQHVEKLNVG